MSIFIIMSEKSHSPTAHSDIFTLLVLSNQQTKHLHDLKQLKIKEANHPIWEAGTMTCFLTFFTWDEIVIIKTLTNSFFCNLTNSALY